MFRNLHVGIGRVALIACTVFLAACAETGAMRSLTTSDVGGIKEGMTRQEVEQKLGSPIEGRDNQGNPVLRYTYRGAGAGIPGTLWVTVDRTSGKVIRVDNYAPHN